MRQRRGDVVGADAQRRDRRPTASRIGDLASDELRNARKRTMPAAVDLGRRPRLHVTVGTEIVEHALDDVPRVPGPNARAVRRSARAADDDRRAGIDLLEPGRNRICAAVRKVQQIDVRGRAPDDRRLRDGRGPPSRARRSRSGSRRDSRAPRSPRPAAQSSRRGPAGDRPTLRESPAMNRAGPAGRGERSASAAMSGSPSGARMISHTGAPRLPTAVEPRIQLGIGRRPDETNGDGEGNTSRLIQHTECGATRLVDRPRVAGAARQRPRRSPRSRPGRRARRRQRAHVCRCSRYLVMLLGRLRCGRTPFRAARRGAACEIPAGGSSGRTASRGGRRTLGGFGSSSHGCTVRTAGWPARLTASIVRSTRPGELIRRPHPQPIGITCPNRSATSGGISVIGPAGVFLI